MINKSSFGMFLGVFFIAAAILFSGGTAHNVLAIFVGPNAWTVDSTQPDNSKCVSPTFLCQTIQAAVSAASGGDTVNVLAGTYTEQVTINKNLTLSGAGAASTTIQAPASLAADAHGFLNIVTIAGSGISVDLSGFTINGPGPSGCNSINTGIFVSDAANAIIHNNTISNIADNPFGGCQNGQGIYVGRTAFSTTGTATITNNTITGYQKTGIVIDNTGSSATITGNTVTGVGPTSAIAENGIQISRGATGSISNNTVSGNECTLAVV